MTKQHDGRPKNTGSGDQRLRAAIARRRRKRSDVRSDDPRPYDESWGWWVEERIARLESGQLWLITFKPQTVNSMMRLEEHLNNEWNRHHWRRREGYIFELGNARCLFFSADPAANVVGGTASLLLECDEAQEVTPQKWTKDFDPMGASTNVTIVFFGTAWTSDTLLATTIDHRRRQESRSAARRVFTADADLVGAEVPAYAEYVRKRVAKLGRNHPLIRTQYSLEASDAEAGMFPPQRQALMRGDHERRHEPEAGHRYALFIDVAGEDETEGSVEDRAMLENLRRDGTPPPAACPTTNA